MEEIDIMEVLYALRDKLKYIVITVVACALVGLIYSKLFVTPMYKSSTTFVLSKSKDVDNTDSTNSDGSAITQSDVTLNSKLVSTYSEIIKSKTLAKQVIDSLGLDMSVDELINSVTVSSKDDTELIEITVSNKDPKLSADIANSLAEVFREKVNEVYNIDNLSVIDIAEPSNPPYNVKTARNVIVFALIGLLASCAVVLVIVYFDDTVKDEKDVETLTEIPVIATIPKIKDLEVTQGGKENGR